nr:Triple gene block 2 Protein [Daphne virus X]
MPLTPPSNQNLTYQIAVVTLGFVILVFAITRDTNTKVGDHYHNLPFGGIYKDGTKYVQYFPAQERSTFHNISIDTHRFYAFCLLVLSPFLVYASAFIYDHCYLRRAHSCHLHPPRPSSVSH